MHTTTLLFFFSLCAQMTAFKSQQVTLHLELSDKNPSGYRGVVRRGVCFAITDELGPRWPSRGGFVCARAAATYRALARVDIDKNGDRLS